MIRQVRIKLWILIAGSLQHADWSVIIEIIFAAIFFRRAQQVMEDPADITRIPDLTGSLFPTVYITTDSRTETIVIIPGA